VNSSRDTTRPRSRGESSRSNFVISQLAIDFAITCTLGTQCIASVIGSAHLLRILLSAFAQKGGHNI
jgi:hypothetical protein